MTDAKENGNKSATSGQKVNGHHGADASKLATGKQSHTTHGPLGKSSKPKKKPGTIGNLLALRRASQRPLPTDMGDGSYRRIATRPTLRQDLSALGTKGWSMTSSRR